MNWNGGCIAVSGVKPDPDYDFVKPIEDIKRGIQCGECGMKFDYNQAYGYYCGNTRCPVQPKATC